MDREKGRTGVNGGRNPPPDIVDEFHAARDSPTQKRKDHVIHPLSLTRENEVQVLVERLPKGGDTPSEQAARALEHVRVASRRRDS